MESIQPIIFLVHFMQTVYKTCKPHLLHCADHSQRGQHFVQNIFSKPFRSPCKPLSILYKKKKISIPCKNSFLPFHASGVVALLSACVDFSEISKKKKIIIQMLSSWIWNLFKSKTGFLKYFHECEKNPVLRVK